MQLRKVPKNLTSAQLSANALTLLLSAMIPFDVDHFAAKVETLTGLEDFAIAFRDQKQITHVEDYKLPEAVTGGLIIGLAPVSIIEQEIEGAEIFLEITQTGTPANVLYRGKLKKGKSEYFTPNVLSTPNVLLK